MNYFMVQSFADEMEKEAARKKKRRSFFSVIGQGDESRGKRRTIAGGILSGLVGAGMGLAMARRGKVSVPPVISVPKINTASIRDAVRKIQKTENRIQQVYKQERQAEQKYQRELKRAVKDTQTFMDASQKRIDDAARKFQPVLDRAAIRKALTEDLNTAYKGYHKAQQAGNARHMKMWVKELKRTATELHGPGAWKSYLY